MFSYHQDHINSITILCEFLPPPPPCFLKFLCLLQRIMLFYLFNAHFEEKREKQRLMGSQWITECTLTPTQVTDNISRPPNPLKKYVNTHIKKKTINKIKSPEIKNNNQNQPPPLPKRKNKSAKTREMKDSDHKIQVRLYPPKVDSGGHPKTQAHAVYVPLCFFVLEAPRGVKQGRLHHQGPLLRCGQLSVLSLVQVLQNKSCKLCQIKYS